MAVFFQDLLDDFLDPDFLKRVREKFHYGETQSDEFQAVAREMLPLMRREAFWDRNISSLRNFTKDLTVNATSDSVKNLLRDSSAGLKGNLVGDELESSAGNLGRELKENSSVTEPEDMEYRDIMRGDTTYEDVVMSLGAGIDSLQDYYSSQGMLSRSYMLEVLASEFLLQGYSAYNLYIEKNTDRHVAKYHFLGSEDDFPMEELPRLLEKMTGQVTCNEAFCMLPKKSVAFVAELTRDGKVRCEGICVGCGNRHCMNRVADDLPARGVIAKMTDLPLTYGYSRIFGKI